MPAIAAVGALDVIVVAGAAIIMLLAVYMLFRPAIQGGLGQLPVVGGWVATHTDQLLLGILANAQLGASAALGPLADLLHRVAVGERTLNGFITGAIDNTFNTMWRIRYQIMPMYLVLAQEYASHLVDLAQQFAGHLAEQLNGSILSHYVQSLQYASHLVDQAQTFAGQLAHWADDRSAARFQQAELDAAAGAMAAAAAGIAAAGQAAQYARALDQALWTDLTGQVMGAERFAEQLTAQTRDWVQQLERLGLAHTDAVGAAVATAAAGATAAVAARVATIEESPCQVHCGVLGDLGSLLQGLEDATLLAALLDLLYEGLTDPGAVERALESALVPLVKDAVGAFQLGIPS